MEVFGLQTGTGRRPWAPRPSRATIRAVPLEDGLVAELWRYPVKSMGGESPAHVVVDARGVEGDRLHAVCDAEGKLGSGKTTRRMRRMDGLLRFAAALPEPGAPPRVTTPTGRVLAAGDPELDGELSRALSIAVQLRREERVSHFDDAPIHLVTGASLAWLRGLLAGSRVDARRFRPNLVIEAPGEGRIEERWIGKTITIGDEVVLRVTGTTTRCVMTTMPQADLPDDRDILRAVAREADACFGVYADVVTPGRIARGDRVHIRG